MDSNSELKGFTGLLNIAVFWWLEDDNDDKKQVRGLDMIINFDFRSHSSPLCPLSMSIDLNLVAVNHTDIFIDIF